MVFTCTPVTYDLFMSRNIVNMQEGDCKYLSDIIQILGL